MATRGSYNIEAYSCYLLFVAVWEVSYLQWKTYFVGQLLLLKWFHLLYMCESLYSLSAFLLMQIIISVLFAMEVVAYLAFYWWKPFVSRVSNWLLTIVAVGSLGSAIWELAAPKEEFTCNGIPVSVPPANILIVFQVCRMGVSACYSGCVSML